MSGRLSRSRNAADRPKRRRWLPWVIAAFVVVGGLSLRVAILFWQRDAWRVIELGPETTVVTEPRTPDGFVDFAGAINLRAGEGVTPKNNAVVLLIQAYGPSQIAPAERTRYFQLLGISAPTESGQYLIDDREFLLLQGEPEDGLPAKLEQFGKDAVTATPRPWSEAEFPALSEFVRVNEAPLQLVVEATRRDRYFSPIPTADAELLSLDYPLETRNRLAARLLTLRAMRRLDAGDIAGSWGDVHACCRLARLTGQSPHTLAVLVSNALNGFGAVGAAAIIKDSRLSAQQARACLDDLDALIPIREAADVIDFGERLTVIDTDCRLLRGRAPNHVTGRETPRLTVKDRAVDWNLVLRQANAHVDDMVRIMRIDDPQERETVFRRARDQLTPTGGNWSMTVGAFLGVSDDLSVEFEKLVTSQTFGAMFSLREVQMTADAEFRVIRLGFAMTVHREEHGAFPDSLGGLEPDILHVIPNDPCSGQEFVYRRTDDGYVLYSVGFNHTDDGGAGYDDDPQGDDLVLRVNTRPPE